MVHPDSPRRALRRGAVAAVVVVVGVGAAPAPALAATNQFNGVNCADPRDNYADDPVVLSGLSTSDSYATAGRSTSNGV